MFLTTKVSHGTRYLYLMESIHVKGKRNPKKKVIQNFGPYDKLSDEIRQQYEDAKAKKELQQRLEQQVRMDLLGSAVSQKDSGPAIEGQGSGNFNRALPLCYGHLAVKNIWEKELGLKYKIDYLQANKTEIQSWQLNDLLFYLTFLKVIDPKSYLGACESKSRFLYCPWNDVVQDNFYRALDFVYTHREGLIKHAVKNHLAATKTEVKVAFFDCTNTWFETPYDDITWQTIRFTREKKKELYDQGKTAEEVEAHLASDAFAAELAEELNLREAEVLRMRGASKEGRYAQPIVTVALAIDQTGFPIDCKVFAGNMSEMKSIKPVLDSLKKKYDIKDVYFVADRGLNSTEGLETIQKEKLGFIVAQKVSRQKKNVRDEMLSLTGYRNCTLDDDGDFHVLEGSDLNENAFRFKICDHVKTSNVALEDGSKKEVTVNCKIVYTYSPERRARDLADLEDQVAKAQKAIMNGALMGNPCGTGWRSLVQTQKEAATNKKDKNMYRAVGIKDDVIAQRREIAGYAALVFSHPEGTEKQPPLQDDQVLSMYHRLVSIEDCFRIMKSRFSIRPVFVWKHDRVVAHCYLCVLALMLMKSLQEKLKAANVQMSAERITKALAQALVVPVPAAKGKPLSFLNLGCTENFHSPEYTGKGRIQQDESEVIDHEDVWKAFEMHRSGCANDTDLVLSAVGLKPLSIYNTLGEIKKRLGVHSVSNEAMLAREQELYIEKVASTL